MINPGRSVVATRSTKQLHNRSLAHLTNKHAARPCSARSQQMKLGVVRMRQATATTVERLPENATSPKTWALMWNLLKQKKVKMITPEKVPGAISGGLRKAKLIDVRPDVDFEKGHVEGAVNVQMFRPIKEWDLRSTLKRAQLAAFGIYPGVEENPEFIAEMRKAASQGDRIVLMCAIGGTIEPTRNLKNGRQSRALTAAYMLYANGYKNVEVVEGGYTSWIKEDLPLVKS
ncbi:hypothetical protein CYMTET_51729 [Cymbomonas tetramitiformis]|uniref:Rhodanese domain-containing protein n=1 Tax=Cymbomonas tetramitiformis TaxID=36881 RepID=A0AAE0BKF1_9CHLO|nr:hypothetical protein CYMTET_51729 [Cymbomonas tetramitiformis]